MFDMHPPRALGADFTTAIFTRIGVDRYTLGTCELGPVYLGWTSRGVTAVRLAGSSDAEAAFTRWYRSVPGDGSFARSNSTRSRAQRKPSCAMRKPVTSRSISSTRRPSSAMSWRTSRRFALVMPGPTS